MSINLNGWFYLGVFGLIVIFIQLVFPNPVPEAILGLLSQDTSHFPGLNPTLQAFLVFYIIGGWASFFTGLIGWFVTNK